MTQELTVVIERDEEGWLVASAPALPGCHTQGRTIEEVRERVREAIQLCLEELGPEDQELRLELVAVERVPV